MADRSADRLTEPHVAVVRGHRTVPCGIMSSSVVEARREAPAQGKET
jgi:hypothetical protein